MRYLPSLSLLGLLLVVRSVAAQTPQAPVPVTAGWQDGFFVQSGNGDYRLQLSMLLQADGRFAIDDPQDNSLSTLAFRRIRPILQGRIARLFHFYFNPDFAGGIVNIRNAWIETRFAPAVRVRVGKDKEPFGLERLHSASSLTFVERALPTTVAPDRDIGVQLLGDVAGGVVSYSIGVFNGVVDGQSTDVDANDSKDLVSRVVIRPFSRMSTPLAGLGLGIAGSTGKQPAALPSFRASGQQTFFSYDRTATGEGVRRRVSPQAFYYYKSFGMFGEYVRSRGDVRKNGTQDDITHEAWAMTGSFVVTGEPASDRGVRPKNVFDPGSGAWGALQVTARYHALRVDPKVIALGFAAASSSREAQSFTLGANWYLNPIIKWVFNFERTVFDGDPTGPRHAEYEILLRNQLSF